MRTSPWTEQQIPDQQGRTVLVTGANSGLGLRSAQVLAARGAKILMTSRSPERGEHALRTITDAGGSAELVLLDLADPTSVRAAAAQIGALTDGGLDVLMNNAGMTAIRRQLSTDGHELQFATNHLGPAALTWLRMPLLAKRPGARVVTLSTRFAQNETIDRTDPNFEHRIYKALHAYNQSKLAALVFTLELNRRLTAAGRDLISVVAHPGIAATGAFGKNAARSMNTPTAALIKVSTGLMDRVLAQSVAMGALSQLRAATDPEVTGGQYYGPAGFAGLRGYPEPIAIPEAVLRPDAGQQLWELTARLTGVTPDPA